jgi:hypothetical protein
MKLRFVLILGIVFAALASAFVPMQSRAADDLDRQQKALNIIADFADKLCKDIPLKGTSSGVELTGNAKAELKGIVSKVAELGFEGAAKYKDSRYEGPLQTDLAVILKDNSDCRRQVWNDLKDKLVRQEPDPPPPSPPGQSAENFTCSLQGCVLFKGDVTCDLTVTNIGQDALLTLSGNTRVFDDLGGEYKLDKACIGNKCESLVSLLASPAISREMISDVPVKVRLVFLGLPQGATQITKLIVSASRGSRIEGRGFSMSFRKIALSPK